MAGSTRSKTKPSGRFSPEQVKQFVEAGNLKTMEDVQSALKELFSQTLQAMLEGELEHHLGYPKNERWDPKNERWDPKNERLVQNDTQVRQERAVCNRRNGHATKNVRSEYGDIALSVPRDREGSFEPLIVQKRQKNVTGIEDQILALYAKGISTRDIQDHLDQLYGLEVSPTFISNVTDKVVPQIRAWQSRPLAPVYALKFLDAVHFKVRQEGRIVSKAAYVVIGVDLEGMKEVLGIWVGEAESAKFWLSVLSEIKSRGTSDILICCTDNLSGFSEAIGAVFPLTQIQKCIVHQVRNSLKYVSCKDRQSVVNDLRSVYTASSEAAGLAALDEFESAWRARYPLVVSSWRSNWSELALFFGFSPELRRLIYTTNIIESFHRQLRKVTHGKALFPNDESLLKMLYLVRCDVQRRWTYRIPHWGQILSQLSIAYGERVVLSS